MLGVALGCDEGSSVAHATPPCQVLLPQPTLASTKSPSTSFPSMVFPVAPSATSIDVSHPMIVLPEIVELESVSVAVTQVTSWGQSILLSSKLKVEAVWFTTTSSPKTTMIPPMKTQSPVLVVKAAFTTVWFCPWRLRSLGFPAFNGSEI